MLNLNKAEHARPGGIQLKSTAMILLDYITWGTTVQ